MTMGLLDDALLIYFMIDVQHEVQHDGNGKRYPKVYSQGLMLTGLHIISYRILQ